MTLTIPVVAETNCSFYFIVFYFVIFFLLALKNKIIVNFVYCANHYHVDCLLLIVDSFFFFFFSIIGSCSMIIFIYLFIFFRFLCLSSQNRIIVDLFVYCVNHYHFDCLILIVDLLFLFFFIVFEIIRSCSMIYFQVYLFLLS